MKKLRVGVIYGGRSGEHEVSLASAAAVFQNLDRDRYEPVAIRIEKDGRWALPERPPTLVSDADGLASITPAQVLNTPDTTGIVASAGSYGYLAVNLSKIP